MEQIQSIVGLDTENAVLASAKSGIGITEILEAIVRDIPGPRGIVDAPLKALIFDSWFDPYRGVIVMVRIIDGQIRKGMKIRLMARGRDYEVEDLGVMTPKPRTIDKLGVGEVGFIVANIKTVSDVSIGDTVTEAARRTPEPFPGFQEIKPMVFAGLYPIESNQYEELRDALEKLRLNDSSFFFEPEVSAALGFGFRCGFLGLLHMEIVQERLEREFNVELITTAPGVRYRITTIRGEVLEVDNPSKMPPPGEISTIEEPIIEAMIMTNEEFLGSILALLDRLKSISRGYASLDYHLAGYRDSDLVRLDILVAGENVDALSLIVHKDTAYSRGRSLVDKMRKLIPRQLFEVPIQAAIGTRVIARETVKAMGKNVLAKCYGGDISRKRKLLEKQKEGKRRMKRVGKVEIPQEAFLAVLKVND